MATPHNKICILVITLLLMQYSFAQNITTADQLPITTVAASADSTKPFILYITGDGGWNKFSKNLSQVLANKGYPVVALNAKEYFWKKKTAEITASDISMLIRNYQRLWKRKKVMLIGYSFGADVMPFVYNHLTADLSAQVVNISLLSPSAFTDFEIHIAVMFGAGFSGGESVVKAINTIVAKPITMIFGKGEDDFPFNQLKIKNYVRVILDGGHHYDGDEEKVCATILQHIPKN